MSMMEILLALSIAAHVVTILNVRLISRRLNYLKRGQTASDDIMISIMEEGAPKMYANFTDWLDSEREN